MKNFRELTNQKLPTPSRLNLYDIQQDVNMTYFVNIFKSYNTSNLVTGNNDFFTIHLAEEDDWWDNISYKYYDTPTLWYIICAMNDIINPFEEIEPGQSIKILKQMYLYNIFKDIQTISEL